MPAPEGHPASPQRQLARPPAGGPAGVPAESAGDEPGSPPGRRPAEPPPGPPASPPLGLVLARTAKEITRAFDDALAEAGGSQPVWLVLISLKTRRLASQRELADAVGIREATLTHHLNAMDASGLITRRRDPQNRRVHLVELTPAGEEAFYRMRKAAFAFNDRLRAGFGEAELAEFGRVLGRLRSNVSGGAGASPERPGD
jgi:MarR family transcriptional regulator for hemolysin